MTCRILVSIIIFISVFTTPSFPLDLLRIESKDAIVLFHPALTTSANDIIRMYPRVKAQLEATFLWEIDFKPVIALIGQSDLFQQMAGHRAFVAFALPEKQVIVIDDTRMGQKPFSREAILKHELCHLLLHRYVEDKRLPKWLDEGVAQWISDGIPDIMNPGRESVLTQAAMSNRFLSLNSIRESFPLDELGLGLAYEQSRSIVDHVITNYGKNGILNILEVLRKGSDINNAVQISLMISVEELEKQWQEDQKGLHYILSYAAMHLYTILFLLAALLTFMAYIRYLIRKKKMQEEPDDTDSPDPENPFST